MIKDEILNRKGARKAVDIPAEVLVLLNKGEIETANLTEWLAINQVELINTVFRGIGLGKYIEEVLGVISTLKKPSTMSTFKIVGETLYNLCYADDSLKATIINLSKHQSDSIRSYATYLVALNVDLSMADILENSKHLVADSHFGVREIVWMALRPVLEKDLELSINLLVKWTSDTDENVRRFASEVLRPRGVWCKHIDCLKTNPEQLLPILEPLKNDDSKYVQDSVANWLNDASKTQPKFVTNLCNKWLKDSPTKNTQKIVKKARRTIDKK